MAALFKATFLLRVLQKMKKVSKVFRFDVGVDNVFGTGWMIEPLLFILSPRDTFALSCVNAAYLKHYVEHILLKDLDAINNEVKGSGKESSQTDPSAIKICEANTAYYKDAPTPLGRFAAVCDMARRVYRIQTLSRVACVVIPTRYSFDELVHLLAQRIKVFLFVHVFKPASNANLSICPVYIQSLNEGPFPLSTTKQQNGYRQELRNKIVGLFKDGRRASEFQKFIADLLWTSLDDTNGRLHITTTWFQKIMYTGTWATCHMRRKFFFHFCER